MEAVKREVYWHREAFPPTTPLQAGCTTQCVIVGGGIAGLMCAEELQEQGKEVVLLERDWCGAGASGKTSGFVTPDSEIELSSLIANHGPQKAKRLWEFVTGGVDAIRSAITRHGFECDAQIQDSLLVAEDAAGWKAVMAEHDARTSLGYESRIYPRAETHSVIGSDAYYGAVRYTDTFGMNSYRYCQELKRHLIEQGVRIHEKTAVTRLHGNGVEANGVMCKAERVIVCTDYQVSELGKLQTETYHAQTFLAISKPLPIETVRAIFPEGNLMVWGTDLIYHYFRITGDNRLLLGGADLWYTYRKREAADIGRFARKLASYFRARFPGIDIELESLWPGLIGVSQDLLPIVAQDSQWPNVHYVSAATGLPWAAALGRYMAEKILHRRDDFDTDFSPSRKWPLPTVTGRIIGTPATFALSHGITKYL